MHPIPSPKEVKQSHLSPPGLALAREIALGKSACRAAVIGPCSIHSRHGALAYADRVSRLQKALPNLLLVMRVYVEKPRTRHDWKGFLYTPTPSEGLPASRALFEEIAQMGVPIATEFVDPLAAYYLGDLTTWAFIGARTSHSQIHRQIASYLPCPVGFKNSLSGDLNGAINGLHAARHPHTFLGLSNTGQIAEIESLGNPYTHLTLRGSETGPNYTAKTDENVLIDCSHGNSSRCHYKQEETAYTVIENLDPIGIMLESHLKSGKQPQPDCPYTSVTDACIDWETTEEILRAYSSRITENQSAWENVSTTFPSTV